MSEHFPIFISKNPEWIGRNSAASQLVGYFMQSRSPIGHESIFLPKKLYVFMVFFRVDAYKIDAVLYALRKF